MKITRPDYYEDFHCVGGRCPDSCCKDWQVDIDEKSMANYQQLHGELGQRLRDAIEEEDGAYYMKSQEGRCPMWNAQGLCDIQCALGEEALSCTCHSFPRLTHDYVRFVEQGLELSCPEAAKLILNRGGQRVTLTQAGDSEEVPSYAEEDMELLLAAREKMLSLLDFEGYSIPEKLALCLVYGCEVQSELDMGEGSEFSPTDALDFAKKHRKDGSMDALRQLFLELDPLQKAWTDLLEHPQRGDWDGRTRNLMVYFIERYFLQAVSDFDVYGRVKFMIASCLLLRELGGDFLETAQKFSKNVENSTENVESLLDAAYSHPALLDGVLFGLLLT